MLDSHAIQVTTEKDLRTLESITQESRELIDGDSLHLFLPRSDRFLLIMTLKPDCSSYDDHTMSHNERIIN